MIVSMEVLYNRIYFYFSFQSFFVEYSKDEEEMYQQAYSITFTNRNKDNERDRIFSLRNKDEVFPKN